MNPPRDIKQIEDSTDFIDRHGNVWAKERHKDRKKYGQWFKKTQHHCFGYLYCSIYRISMKKTVSMRVHKLVAKAFCKNDDPKLKKVVGHRNNKKDDNRAENLYWTTVSENTQKAVDDGLLVNDRGWEDSQSMPVSMYDFYTNRHISDYGSAGEASRATGVNESTILRQCRYHRPMKYGQRPFYFRFLGDETTLVNPVIIAFDFDTDRKIGEYLSYNDASKQTGVPVRTVAQQVKMNRKPKWSKSNIYFLARNKA